MPMARHPPLPAGPGHPHPIGLDMRLQHLRRQAYESRVLQKKVAQLEAQLRRLSAELLARLPVPPTRPRLPPDYPALHH